MDVQVYRHGVDVQVENAGLFPRLAQRGSGEGRIGRLAMTAELHPASDPGMQRQQHRAPIRRQRHRARRHMTGHAGPCRRVRPGFQQGKEALSDGSLRMVGRRPHAQYRPHIGMQAGVPGDDSWIAMGRRRG